MGPNLFQRLRYVGNQKSSQNPIPPCIWWVKNRLLKKALFLQVRNVHKFWPPFFTFSHIWRIWRFWKSQKSHFSPLWRKCEFSWISNVATLAKLDTKCRNLRNHVAHMSQLVTQSVVLMDKVWQQNVTFLTHFRKVDTQIALWDHFLQKLLIFAL